MRFSNQLVFSTTLILCFWYLLSFIGVPGLIDSWFEESLVWVVFASSLLFPLPIALWSYSRKHNYTDWMMLAITASWLTLAYFSHWQWFFSQPSDAKIERYYRFFNDWYLLQPMTDRIVPDGYHLILHCLIALLFIQVVIRLIKKVALKVD